MVLPHAHQLKNLELPQNEKICTFSPGDNKEAILQEWKDITKAIQAHIIVLDMPLLNATQYKDSLGNLIIDLVLQILSWLAEEERTKTKTRQREGIELAKKQGKHLGRPRTKISEEFISAYTSWKENEISALEAMIRCNMTSPTFYRVVKRYEDKE